MNRSPSRSNAGRRRPSRKDAESSDSRNSNSKSNSGGDSDDVDAEEYFPGDVSEDIFWNVADSFIEVANNQGDDVPMETVNAALLYAAARYSAFVAVNQHAQNADGSSVDESEAGSSETLDSGLEPDTVGQYFALQFRKLFDENLSQYIDVPAVDDESSD